MNQRPFRPWLPWPLVLLVLLAAGALRAAPPPAPRPEAVLIGAGADALAEQERAFARSSVERGTVAAWTGYLAADAIQLPADVGPLHGLPAILEWVKSSGLDTPGTALDWWPLHVEIGYTFGEWEFRLKGGAPGDRPLARGKFASVWKKQADGTWKVVLDTGNEYPAKKS